MKINLEKLIKRLLQDKITACPDKHSAQTPSCLSYSRFKSIVEGKTKLSADEEKHLEGCSYCQMVLDTFREYMVADMGFDSIESAKELATKFLKEMAPAEDLKEFEETWENFFNNNFDWDSGHYKELTEEAVPSITEIGLAFGPSMKPHSLILLCIKFVAEIRAWMLKSPLHRIQTRRDELQRYLIDQGFKTHVLARFFQILDTLFAHR